MHPSRNLWNDSGYIVPYLMPFGQGRSLRSQVSTSVKLASYTSMTPLPNSLVQTLSPYVVHRYFVKRALHSSMGAILVFKAGASIRFRCSEATFSRIGDQHGLPWYVGSHLAVPMAVDIVCHELHVPMAINIVCHGISSGHFFWYRSIY